MKGSWKTSIWMGLILVLLSGCATTGTNPRSSDPADSTKTDATRTTVEGAAVGTAVGAGLGAIVGAIVGGKKGAGIGAAIGGATGLAGGALFGKKVAERKQAYVDTEERLDSEIQTAADTNAQLRTYNAQTENKLLALNKEIARLRSQYKSRKISYDRLKKKQEEIKASVNDGEQQKSSMEKELNALNEYLASMNQTQQPKTAQLQKEVDELKKGIAMLDSNNKQMAKMADSLTVRK